MLKRFLPLLIVGLVACSEDCPPPKECPDPPPPCEECKPCPECPPPVVCEECPETLVCPEGYTLEKEELEWECELIKSPPPEVEPSDYIATDRALRIIHDVDVESRSEIYLDIWPSVRHPSRAGMYCPDYTVEVLHKTPGELFYFANEGQILLDEWNIKWRVNLATPNKRCEERPEFCVVSNVKKGNWTPYVERLRKHKAEVDLQVELVLADPKANCNFDNPMGWCDCRRGLLPPR